MDEGISPMSRTGFSFLLALVGLLCFAPVVWCGLPSAYPVIGTIGRTTGATFSTFERIFPLIAVELMSLALSDEPSDQ